MVNDGEVSKPDYATYVTKRLSGFSAESTPVRRLFHGVDDFPEFRAKQWKDPEQQLWARPRRARCS